MSRNKRIVVTGIGLVTPLGADVKSSWNYLIEGKDARNPITLFDTSGCRCHEGAEVVRDHLPSPQHFGRGSLSRASALALPAIEEALEQARLLGKDGKCLISDLPMSVSTSAGAMEWGESFLRRVLSEHPYRKLGKIAQYQSQQQILDFQKSFGIQGHSMIVGNACASGANAIGHGADLIRAGFTECVLVGGYEALTELLFVGFDCLQALSPTSCRPFDQKRDGLMLGEGAAFLVLETAEHACQREVEVLCELAGYGQSTDQYHLTHPSPNGTSLTEAMNQAFEQAGTSYEDIGYINAHGTATPANDQAEVQSYVSFFSELPSHVRVSSTKAAIGHTLGAAGAIEAVFTIMGLKEGRFPPQLNTQEPIEEVIDHLVSFGSENQNKDQPCAAMTVNLGFGGSNAALLFRGFKG